MRPGSKRRASRCHWSRRKSDDEWRNYDGLAAFKPNEAENKTNSDSYGVKLDGPILSCLTHHFEATNTAVLPECVWRPGASTVKGVHR